MTIIAAADGSALGNPGPAGWAWYIDEGHWRSGGWAHGTNNMGELMAVLDLLRQTAHLDEPLLVYCDSTYVINTITKWMAGWKRKGWKKGDGKPVLNLDLIQALDEEMTGRSVKFEWVKGHSGHELNEKADELANAAATSFRDQTDLNEGPGMAGAAAGETPTEAFAPTNAPEVEELEPDLFSSLEGYEDVLTDEEQVVAAERSLLTDEVRADPAAVAALLHPDWYEIGASGRLIDREEALTGLAPCEVEMEVLSVTAVTSESLLLVWRSVNNDGGEGSVALHSSLWEKTAQGRWRQRFRQGTPEALS